ncbi:Interferon, partial [Antrostomus carolinensis]
SPATPQPRLPHTAPALLLLLTALPTALACHHLRTRHPTFPWDTLQLLHAMAPSPPQPCQHHHHPPFFPDTLLQHTPPHQAARTALRILQHLFHTLSSPNTPHHWHAHARHHLLNSLQHHIHRLQRCLTDNATLSPGQGPQHLSLNITRYSRDIRHFLRAHGHSACAWDHVLLEARSCLRHVDTLLR